jgi:hypothetical protein
MLNRYLTKTLFKGFALQRMFMTANRGAKMSQNAQLLQFSKMTFFDYDNKDKNIFSSDSDDEGSVRQYNDKQQGFFRKGGFEGNDKHEGKYELEDIPLYISKMRNEMRERKGRSDNDSYFGRFKSFLSMHHQNKDRIFAEFPRSSTVFYEYCAHRTLQKESNFLTILEDQIVNEQFPNMPLAGIKNFAFAMARLRRSREDILKKIEDHLIERQGFKDVKNNIHTLKNLVLMRHELSEDYLIKSFEAIQDEIKIQIEQGSIVLDNSKISSIKYTVTKSTFLTAGDIAIKFLCNQEKEIPEKDVIDFVKNLKSRDVEGFSLPIVEGSLDVTSHCLLAIAQYAKAFKTANLDVHAENLATFKYLEVCQPHITAHIPELKDLITSKLEDYKQRISSHEMKPRDMTKSQTKISRILDEQGVFYKTHQRFEDCYLAQFYIPNDDVILEYHEMKDFLRTNDNFSNRKYIQRVHQRNQILKKGGNKLALIDFIDFLEKDNQHQECVKLVKEKIEAVK